MAGVTYSRPVRFAGTDAEREANRATHHFHTYCYGEDDFETRCVDCDCKTWHAAADYPCGTEPPREVVTEVTP
jgi:ketosteroid isomerase-like protein